MPKHTFNFKQLQGTSASGKQGNANNDASKKKSSVNERLSELRQLAPRDAAKKKAELAESVSQKSVPPQLRAVLGMPESAPPRPKRGVRARMPNRTPGPAPPESWTKRAAWSPLLALRTGRRRLRKIGDADLERNRPDHLMRFARMAGSPPKDIDQRPSSLLHLSLKTAAEQWDLFDEEDLPSLSDLPLRLRLALISYVGFYGPPIGTNVLDALTKGTEPVYSLDLAGLIGHGNLTMSRLAKFAKQQTKPVEEASVAVDNVVESWDQEDTFEAALQPSLSISRLLQLTHLSLSHPATGVSWKDLLSFTKHTPSITHLSLAYWPRPTLTPNLSTTTVSSTHSPDITAGGSHFYSVLDEDLIEPASILRQLSSNLLRLFWLDLEGCTEWAPALAAHRNADASAHDRFEEWPSPPSAAPSIFLHNWKNLHYLNCSQGWTPKFSTLRSLPRQTMPLAHRRIVDKVIERLDVSLPSLSLADEAEGLDAVAQRRAQTWLELEDRAFTAERKINAARRGNSSKLVDFDHGWNRDD